MSNFSNRVSVVILAAGLGTRMKSDRAKVLHELKGRPMILYVVDVARRIAGDNVVVVVGHQAERVKAIVSAEGGAHYALQAEQLGTGHAVMCAIDSIPPSCEQIIILCGDVPLLTLDTLSQFVDDHIGNSRAVSVLAVELENPTGYGRILRGDDGGVVGIVEEADADQEQKRIGLINTGIYCVNKGFLQSALADLKTDNAQGEFYLTDIIRIAYQNAKPVGVSVGENPVEFSGINSQEDLRAAEKAMDRQDANIA
ncbi:MAG: NTP transferase domain-containing protein [Desulfobacterales bacterium]|jgi:UDP-N-acetylglucosamine diphosphorylase/glucosamine-1-phosphate N-acetyltransferase